MNLLKQHEFWYALAGMVSACMGMLLIDKTLAAKERRGGAVLPVWCCAALGYLLFNYIGNRLTSPLWYDYFIFFGWLIFLLPPALALYRDHHRSSVVFIVVTAVFVSNVTSFLTGSTTTMLNSTNPFGEQGYRFLMLFTLIKVLISAVVILLYLRYGKRVVISVFESLEGKMSSFIAIPFISSIGFFIIVQIVQQVGLLPDKGVLFVLFYLTICISFGEMYWLIFSNVLWSSRAIRTQTELDVASSIQRDMLPCIFPPFPERGEFDIYASMEPAKEVGGDFYDFFLIDDSHLAVVIADVSGKGVPAALFMVIAKTLIKNYAQMGAAPAEVFTAVNNQLCENNGANMFVTAFMGVWEIGTGKFTYVNAGHNPPLVRRAGGDFQWLQVSPDFVLAGMEDMVYTQHQTTLGEGDLLYLYTDGVTEALNPAEELYTEERLLSVINSPGMRDMGIREIVDGLRRDIQGFANGAEQADDVTMLLLGINE